VANNNTVKEPLRELRQVHEMSHRGIQDLGTIIDKVMEDFLTGKEEDDVLLVVTKKPIHIQHKGWRIEVYTT
jgi:hypothetical protein